MCDGWITPETVRAVLRRPDAPVSDRLTAEAVASLLGVRPSTVRSYAARGQMPRPDPCPCCGHGATWDRQQIIDWHEGRRSQTDQPRSQP